MPEDSGTAGSYTRLKQALRRVTDDHAKAIREIAQKECEADLKANDAILARANQLMAACAVALTLLVGLTKDKVADSVPRTVLLCVALAAAAAAIGFVIACTLVRGAHTQMKNATIAGEGVTEAEHANKWQRDHELSVALEYLDIRDELAPRHTKRARLLQCAQWSYTFFVGAVVALGFAIATC